MQTVLGLSMTSTSVGWTLLDGQGPDAASLDHDAFDVQFGTNGAEADTSRHAAAARGAQAIAAASGHQVGSVQVTWTEDVEAAGTALLESISELGFANVHAVSFSRAAQAWGIEIGRANEYTKTGLCILEPDAATVMIIATGAGSVRTAVTDTRETVEELVEWLRTVFRKDGWLPEALYLVGALADLDAVTQPIADALPIPVSDSADTQLALARGAALTTTGQVDVAPSPPAEAPREATWRVSIPRKTTASATEDTVAAPAVAPAVTETMQAVEAPPDPPPSEPTRHERPWLVAHAKKLTIGAAAVAVFGAALSLAAGSALNVEIASTQAADSATAADASVPSSSVHPVPAPAPALPAPPLQPMAAQPPPVAPPPPPEPRTLPAEPVAVAAPQPAATPKPVAVPIPHPTVTAPPTHVPVAAPAAPPPAAPLALPAVPPPAAPVAAPEAPPPVAPFGLPPAPPPAAPFGVPAPPPPAAPVAPPAAPAPPPADDAPSPPPDPIQVVLSPLFSGLP